MKVTFRKRDKILLRAEAKVAIGKSLGDEKAQ